MSFTPDLEKTEWWHDINLAYSRSIPEKFTAIMVGWMGNSVPTTGRISPHILEKLKWAYNNRTIDQGWLGEHECEICHNHVDRAELLVINGDEMYVAPRMILHYIEAHSYLPPKKFLTAVATMHVSQHSLKI